MKKTKSVAERLNTTQWTDARVKGRLPPRLAPCPGCRCHIYPQAKKCPHCGEELKVLRRKQLAALDRAHEALEVLQRIAKQVKGEA